MRRLVALALGIVLAIPGVGRAHPEGDLTRYVDPSIGTLGAGFVFPGPAAPYGMVQLSPDTNGYFAYTGYQYIDAKIRGFGHVHTEAMGVPEGGEIPFMPEVGSIVTDVRAYEQPFSHATEHAEPGYYS
ncbi:MAG: glycoside hydrolase family 92 protein, partial [Actinobacteria bacterium]|nr:glycoside hydrolase family 92 protein [Actinomycetota bacterium]